MTPLASFWVSGSAASNDVFDAAEKDSPGDPRGSRLGVNSVPTGSLLAPGGTPLASFWVSGSAVSNDAFDTAEKKDSPGNPRGSRLGVHFCAHGLTFGGPWVPFETNEIKLSAKRTLMSLEY